MRQGQQFPGHTVRRRDQAQRRSGLAQGAGHFEQEHHALAIDVLDTGEVDHHPLWPGAKDQPADLLQQRLGV